MAIDEEQIRNWLMEEDLIREKIYDENANFHYIINFPNNNAMDIIQPKTKEDVLIIGCATEVSQEEQNIINNSPKKTKILGNFSGNCLAAGNNIGSTYCTR